MHTLPRRLTRTDMKYCELIFTAVLFWIQLSTINSDDSAENEVALSAAVKGINTFSTSLYKVLSEKPGNLVVSPFSVEAVVAMLLLGLGGDTATQVSAALHLPGDHTQVAQGFKALFQILQNTENVTLEIANKIYVQEGFEIKDEYLKSTEKYFMSVAEEVDISGDTENVRQAVNNWAAEKTHNKIRDLLPEGSLTPEVVMILLNAIYFKGLWENSFNKDATQDGVFHLSSSSTKEVPMMHLTANLMHADLPEHDLQILKLPYQGGKHSMLILLPNSVDGLQQLESNIKNLNFTLVRSSLWEKEVDVTLPRFKILNTTDLNEPLAKLGMGVLFRGGNFSGITDASVHVSKAIQKAFVEVNEEGTEAAAVTVLFPIPASYIFQSPPRIVRFTADGPFMYMIMDEERDTILFMGRVVEPQE